MAKKKTKRAPRKKAAPKPLAETLDPGANKHLMIMIPKVTLKVWLDALEAGSAPKVAWCRNQYVMDREAVEISAQACERVSSGITSFIE